MNRTLLFIILAISGNRFNLNAQLSASDSNFLQTVFTESMYADPVTYPGNWYLPNSFNSIQQFYASIDSMFKFHTGDFNNAYQQIELGEYRMDTLLNPTFNYYYNQLGTAYFQYDPLFQQDFTLNGIHQTAHFTVTSGLNSSCKTAFFIIPGSGQNQTSEIIQEDGYYNLNCQVKSNLLNYGDVYIHTKPLEDYRAICWNGHKLNSEDYVTPGAASFIYSYLNSFHRPFGVNYLIECLATIKMLKQKYQRVVIIGCSQGGYATLLCALNSPVDGALVSSGYSVNFDSSQDVMYELTQIFDTLVYAYDKNTIKNQIAQSGAKQFHFSYGDNDAYYYQLEHDSSYTKNYYNGISNTQFYTGYNYHALPTCLIIDSIIDKIHSIPSVRFIKISEVAGICTARVKLCAPDSFNFYLVRNGAVVGSYFNNVDSIDLQLSIPGVYTLTGVTSNSSVLFCADSILLVPAISTYLEDYATSKTQPQLVNPIQHVLQFVDIDKVTNAEIQITSTDGRIMFEQQHWNVESEIKTDSWPSGIYLVVLNIDGRRVNYKALK